MSDTSTNIEMFSESDDNMEDIIDILNDQIEELEQKVEYYKNKANDRFRTITKQWIEMEQQKRKIENLKSLLISKMPEYLHTIIKYL